jgi:hypothetical protein
MWIRFALFIVFPEVPELIASHADYLFGCLDVPVARMVDGLPGEWAGVPSPLRYGTSNQRCEPSYRRPFPASAPASFPLITAARCQTKRGLEQFPRGWYECKAFRGRAVDRSYVDSRKGPSCKNQQTGALEGLN